MRTVKAKNRGFVMPMTIIMMTTLLLVSLVINQAIVHNQRQITRYGYVLIARAAAKGAVDLAKEELDSNLSYCGTPENRNDPALDSASTVLYDQQKYKVTFEVEIVDNACSTSSNASRNIRAIGRVYIPDISVNAAYVQDIRTRIVRSGINSDSPGDFSPVGWYKADGTATDRNSVRQIVASSDSDAFNRTSRHEEQTNGTVNSAVCHPSNNDLEFHVGNENSGQQRIGLTFNNIAVPPDATITNAYIQFRSRGINGTGGTSAQLSQPLTTRIWGYDTGNKAAFTCPGNNQLTSTAGLTSQQIDWAMQPWNTQNQSGAAQRTPDLASLVQTIVNRGDWNSGNSMGFRFERVSGSGLRNASYTSANHIRLVVEWETSGTYTAATNNTTVAQWLDQTANSNHLNLVNGNPILRTNQINGKQAVEFQASGDDPDVLAHLDFSPVLADEEGLTVVAVMRPTNTGASGGGDRFVSLVNSSQTDDSGLPANGGGVQPYVRSGLTNSVIAAAHNYTAQPIANALGGSFASSSWGVYAFTLSNQVLERFSRSGTPSALFEGGNALNFSADQLLIGGTSTGGGNYGLPGDMQIAELVMYDKTLSCNQLRLIENYYRQASVWNIAGASYACTLQ